MIEIITDASERSLAEAVERSLWETWKVLARSPLVELHEDEQLLRLATGVPDAAMNGVLRCRVPGDAAGGVIEETLAFFRGRGLPFTWWAGRETLPEDLGARLQAPGLTPHETPLIGAAADLAKVNWIGGSPAGLTLELVQDAEGYRVFQEVHRRAARTPASVSEAMCEIVCGIGFGEDVPLLHYLARLDGKPVGTATLSLAGGIAGVYEIATLPETKGIEMALSLVAFQDAREWDFRIGVMHLSHLAFNSLRHLGLQEYCEINRYVWSPPARAHDPSADAASAG